MSETKDIRIVNTEIHNFKSITSLNIDIHGSHVFLIGDNGVGKTSVIQALQASTGGPVPPDAVRHGEDNAVIRTTFSDGTKTEVKIHRSGKNKYTLIYPNGLRDDRKTAMQTLFGSIDFDIEDFAKWSKTAEGRRKQIELIRKILPQQDRDAYDRFTQDIASKEATRTEVNRKVAAHEAVMKSLKIEQYDLETYAKPKDASEILAKIQAAEKYASDYAKVVQFIEDSRVNMESISKSISEDNAEIEALLAKVEVLRKKVGENEAKRSELSNRSAQAQAWLNSPDNPKPDRKVLETAKAELETLASHNERHADVVKYNEETEKWTEASKESKRLTAEIEASRQARRDLVAKNPNIPIEGLWFDDDQVYITREGQDFPLDEQVLSTSLVMEIGIRIAFALDNSLKVVYIGRGESIGKKRLEIIEELSKKYKFQVIFENVIRGKEELQVVVTERLVQ